MVRLRVASLLGIAAVLALVAATLLVRQRDDASAYPSPSAGNGVLVVRDPRTGSTLEVPRAGWRVEHPRVRIWYADGAGRPVAVAHGPAVYGAGYCRARPRGSSRAFAGFTRDGFDAWVEGLTRGRGTWSTGVDRSRVTLAGGVSATLLRTALHLGPGGPCSATGVEVAMVRAGDVRVVLVRDDTPDAGDGSLPADAVEPVLRSLRVRGGVS